MSDEDSPANSQIRELAILSVASRLGYGFELYAHEAIGRSVGLSEDYISALRHGQLPDFDNPDDCVSPCALVAVGLNWWRPADGHVAWWSSPAGPGG
jgi:hypothetical protein